VGLALVGAVTGLAATAAQKARAADARASCADHLRRIGTAARAYAAANDDVLPRNTSQPPAGSWNTQLLPFLGEAKLAERYAPGRDWAEGDNRAVAAARVPVFVCPAAPHPDRWVLTQNPDDGASPFKAAPTDYVGSAGAYLNSNAQANLHPGAMHTRTVTRRLRTADVADGTAQTLLVVEMADKPNVWRTGRLGEDRLARAQMPALSGQWAAPNWNHLRSYSADGATQFGPCSVNCSNGASVYGFHPSGAHGLFVDGSVRFLKAGMSQEMLVALVSIAGGEVLGPNDF
jgi:prepilin-type processing-associated H-X9-DG protein